MRQLLNAEATVFVPRSAQMNIPTDAESAPTTLQSASRTPSPQISELMLVVRSVLNVHAAVFLPQMSINSETALSRSTQTASRKSQFNIQAEVVVPKKHYEQQVYEADKQAGEPPEASLHIPSGLSAPDSVPDRSDGKSSGCDHTDGSSLDSLLDKSCETSTEIMESAEVFEDYTEESHASQEVSPVLCVGSIDLIRESPALPLAPIHENLTASISSVTTRSPTDIFDAGPQIYAFAPSTNKLLPVLFLFLTILRQFVILVRVAGLPAIEKMLRGRAAYPWEHGFGPSFRQAVTDKLADLKALNISTLSPVQQAVVSTPHHHWSYLGDSVPYAHDTDPAVSLAVIVGPPKGAMSNLEADTQPRLHAILWQAFLHIDPVIFRGDLGEFKGCSISEIRNAVIGRVWRYFQLGGTWSDEDYPGEFVCRDQNLISAMPPVFTEFNDCGFEARSDTVPSFRSQIEIAQCRDEAANKERANETKKPGFLGLSRLRSWSPPGPSGLTQMVLDRELPSPSLVALEKMLQPAQVPRTELGKEEDNKSCDRKVNQPDQNDEEAQEEDQVSTNEALSEPSLPQSQICLPSNGQAVIVMGDSSSVCSLEDEDICMNMSNLFSTNQTEVDSPIQVQKMDLLREQGAASPLADDGSSSTEESEEEVSEEEEDPITAHKGLSPIFTRHARRSFSNPLPEAGKAFESTFLSSHAVSTSGRFFGGISSELAYRPRANLPRFSASWNLQAIPAKSPSRRPEAPLSPIMLAAVTEDEEDIGTLADIEDNDEEEQLSMSTINQAFREFNGIPEPGLQSLPREFGVASTESALRTPTTLTRYRRRQSDIHVLPTIMSSPEGADDEHDLIDGISYTPPPPTPSSLEEPIASPLSSTSSFSGDAVFGSSPPDTPTRSMSIVFSRTAGVNLLDGIGTSPIGTVASPAKQPVLSFSETMTLADIESDESTLVGEEFFHHTRPETTSLQDEFAVFQPSDMLHTPQATAPSLNTTLAHGHLSINKLPEVKKTWRLNKIMSVLSKPKQERQVLKKQNSRRVSGSTMASEMTLVSPVNDAFTKKGFWGSVKSKISGTTRRR